MNSKFEDDFFNALELHYSGKPSVKKYLELLEQEPNNSLILYLLASAYNSIKDNKNSSKYYKNAVALNSNIEFSNNFTNEKDIIKRAFASLVSKKNPFVNEEFEKPFKLKPIFDFVYSNVASLYRGANDLSNTVRICKTGLEEYPDSRFIKWIYGGALLKSRFMEYGWKYFDDRVLEFYKLPEDFMKKEVYNFQSTNKPIYVHFAGGLGDTIFFARYLPLLKEKGIEIISKPQKSMKRLFLASGLSYYEDEVSVDDFDYRINFMGLAGIFKTTETTIPFPEGFLKADKQDIEDYRSKYFNTDKKKIGIIWNTGKDDVIRKIELKELIPLFKNKNCQFYSLQHEITNEERAILKRNNVINLGEDFSDWEDTAAALSNLDLYIGVDTSVSNLAGALGIKSYILVLDFCEWRWWMNEETTPWFTSTTVLRQKTHGDWSDVVGRVKKRI